MITYIISDHDLFPYTPLSRILDAQNRTEFVFQMKSRLMGVIVSSISIISISRRIGASLEQKRSMHPVYHH